ncbi:uncharacterized protein SPSK_10494 [Sporothrix schenckii 1099-18]|uniref:Uncharacterized protein n=1 Tax=Sporothrix schenckii 1099-18 TaxID=1397361 RepID=A0A0F2MAE6_SPOSC|nr:uncharacterized protein SPSK_10494 [Sporothrix schenckii 1099-18]KJR86612.1 hypothetical protein SPSK_10494 [Sporothrix schenckii 1099-18]
MSCFIPEKELFGALGGKEYFGDRHQQGKSEASEEEGAGDNETVLQKTGLRVDHGRSHRVHVTPTESASEEGRMDGH